MERSTGNVWLSGRRGLPGFYPQEPDGLVSKDASGGIHKLAQDLSQMNSRRVVIDSQHIPLNLSSPSIFEVQFENMKRVVGVKMVEATVPRNGGTKNLILRAKHSTISSLDSDLKVTVNTDASLHDIGLVLVAYMHFDGNKNIVDAMNSNAGTLFATEKYKIISLPNGFLISVIDGAESELAGIETLGGEWPDHVVETYSNNDTSVFVFTQTSRSVGTKGCPYVCVEGMGILEFPINVGGSKEPIGNVPHDPFCVLIEDNDRQKPIVSNRSPAKWFKNPISSLDRMTVSLKNSDGSAYFLSSRDRVILIFDIICE